MIHPLNKRNGTLELWRFLFSLYILLFHIEKNFFYKGLDSSRLDVSLCIHGAIGVEFFFLLTGIFLAQSVRKELSAPAPTDDLGGSTLRYLGKKCKGIFPCHLIAFAVIFIVTVWSERMKWLAAAELLIGSLPDVLLVQWSGIPSANLNGVEWYLSVMLISSAVSHLSALPEIRLGFQQGGGACRRMHDYRLPRAEIRPSHRSQPVGRAFLQKHAAGICRDTDRRIYLRNLRGLSDAPVRSNSSPHKGITDTHGMGRLRVCHPFCIFHLPLGRRICGADGYYARCDAILQRSDLYSHAL